MATIKEHYFPMLKKAVVQEVPAGDFRRWARSGEPPPGGEPVFVKVYLRAAPAPHSEGELRAAVAAKVGLPLSQVAVKALRNAPVLQIEVNAPDTGTRDAVTEWFKKEEAQDVIRDATGIDIVEPGLVILQSAPAADEDGGDESDDEPPADAHAAAADAPPPPKSKVPRTTTKPWRASSTCDGALHGSQKHMLWPVELMNEGATLSDVRAAARSPNCWRTRAMKTRSARWAWSWPRSTARISSRMAIIASQKRSISASDSLSVGSTMSVPAIGNDIVGAWNP